MSMHKDRRIKQPAIPDNINDLLTDEQVYTLSHLERFGWYVCFVRRPLFQEPTVVLHNYERDTYRWLMPDGDFSHVFEDLRPTD